MGDAASGSSGPTAAELLGLLQQQQQMLADVLQAQQQNAAAACAAAPSGYTAPLAFAKAGQATMLKCELLRFAHGLQSLQTSK